MPVPTLLTLLQQVSASLTSGMRRVLILFSSMGLTLYAGTTADALRGGQMAEAAAGLCLLGAMGTAAAIAWTGRPRRQRRRS